MSGAPTSQPYRLVGAPDIQIINSDRFHGRPVRGRPSVALRDLTAPTHLHRRSVPTTGPTLTHHHQV